MSLLEGIEKFLKKDFFDSWYSCINLCRDISKREILFYSNLRVNVKNILIILKFQKVQKIMLIAIVNLILFN